VTLTFAFLPLAVALLLTGVLSATHRALRPRDAVRAMTAALMVTSIAALSSLWVLSLGFLSHSRYTEPALGWCSAMLGVHADVPALIGLPAVAVSAFGLVRAVRLFAATTRLRCATAHGVDVVDGEALFAYTLPGPAGRVVISTAMLALLDDEESAVVLAHEHAHGVHRHDRYLLLATLTSALFPPLGHLSRRLQFGLERWADEDAARAMDGDRRLVARTIAKVAVGSPSQHAPALGITGLGATGRVRMLLQPPRVRPWSRVWASCALLATTTIAAYQLHHVAALITALCHQ